MHWDDPEGWDREGGCRGVQDGEHMYTHGGFMSIHVKKTKKEKKKHKMTPLRNPSSMQEAGHSKLVPWTIQTDGMRREGGGQRAVPDWGIHVHPWLTHVNVWQNPPQYCKVISLQL